VEPSGLEVREVGVILQVMPEVTPDGSLINLTMSPQLVSEPEWKDYGAKYADSKGKEQQAKMDVPFFHAQTATTSISIKDGATLLFGGGMPSKDPTKVVYAFVTARRVGMDGKTPAARCSAGAEVVPFGLIEGAGALGGQLGVFQSPECARNRLSPASA